MKWKEDADIGLCVAILITLAFTVFYLPDGSPIRFAFAIPAMFFVPGYLFLSALWPGKNMSMEEKIALSVAMSLIVDVAVGLALSALAHISLSTIMAALLCYGASMMAIIVYLRSRYTMGTEDEEIPDNREGEKNLAEKIAAKLPVFLLVFALIGASAAVVPYYYQGKETDTGFSSLYVLDKNRTVNDLPKEMEYNQTAEIIVGVSCMEKESTEYHIRIWFGNESRDNNASINITLEEGNFTLIHGEKREFNISLSPANVERMIMEASGNDSFANASNISHFNGIYRIGASLDIGRDGTIDNTIWLRVGISE